MLLYRVPQQLCASIGGQPETLDDCRSTCLPSVASKLVTGALGTSLRTTLEEVVDEEQHKLKQG